MRACAGCDDDRVGGVITRATRQDKGPLRKIDLFNIVIFNPRAETFGVLAHPFHQLGAHDAGIITRPVVDFGRGHQLPANFNAGNHHGRQVGTRGIDRRCVTSWAGTYNDNWGVAIFGHRRSF